MTIAQRIGQMHQAAEINTKASDFAAMMKLIAAAGRGGIEQAQIMARDAIVSMRVIEALDHRQKAAVAALSTTGAGAPLADFQNIRGGFLQSLRASSAFDAMLPAMLPMPLRTRISVVTIGASGSRHGEGQTKKLTKLSLDSKPIDERTSVGLFVFSKELALLSTPQANGLFERELRRAVAAITDDLFLELAMDGVTPVASLGSSVEAARADLRLAFEAIAGDASSAYFILMDADTAKALAFSNDESGAAAFPGMTPTGGTIASVPAVVTDALSGEIVVMDAAQFAGAPGDVDIQLSTQATLQLNDTPDSPPTASTAMVNLWQHGLLAMKAERMFGAKRLRDTAVAVISGVAYGANSPA